MIIKNFREYSPRLENIYCAQNCTIIGNVLCKKDVSIWYGAVLRGDVGSIVIEEGSNIQDNCVLHVGYDHPIFIDKNVTIGHSAVIHGCTIGENTLIGMHATLLDGCQIGKNCIIGAGTLVLQNSIIPDGSVVVGNPGRVIKTMTDKAIEANKQSAKHYIEYAKEELEAI